MKVVVVLALLVAVVAAVPLQGEKKQALPLPKESENLEDGVKRDKRQFGFNNGMSAAGSLNVNLDTPLGSIGLSSSKAYSSQKGLGLGLGPLGLGLGGGLSGANANSFNAGIDGPLGGFGIGSSNAGAFNSGFGLGKKKGFGHKKLDSDASSESSSSEEFGAGVFGPLGKLGISSSSANSFQYQKKKKLHLF